MSEQAAVENGRPSRRIDSVRPIAGAATPDDPTIVAVGTSLTWCTGNAYDRKYPDLVHRDLTGDYPIGEKYLHYDGDVDADAPDPRYYEQTAADGYSGGDHPNGDHIPPVQYRARGGAIIGLSEPYRHIKGKKWKKIETNDQGGYLNGGQYYGKLDYAFDYQNLFDDDDIDESMWTIARDIGWHWPTIVQQIDQFPWRGEQKPSLDVPNGKPDLFGGDSPEDEPPYGEDVDVVIIDGGTNDIELGWLNNPTATGRTHIWRAIKRHMYDDMTGSQGLLQLTRRKFPNAVIVLVGEPIYASNRTDHGTARSFLIQSDWIASIYAGAVEQSIDNALNFAHMAPYWLRRAAAEEAWRDDGPGIVYAPPGYGVVNSMLADWPWSWGFVPNNGNGYSPDDTVDKRQQVCHAEDDREPGNRPGGKRGDDDDEIAFPSCPAASIGHPNHEGCRQYADAIVSRYKQHVDRSVGTVEDELNGSETDSLKTAMQLHGFDPGNDGIRRPLAHRTVDSIKAKFWTESGSGEGVHTGKVYLKVYPGRTGNGERFRLDTETNDLRPDGPKNPGSGNPDDEFYIDPMMGRRLDGAPGNMDANEIGASKQNERNNQSYRVGDDPYDDRPLRLGDVVHATLVLEGVDPGDGWGLEKAELSLNGWVSRTVSFQDGSDEFHSDDKSTEPFATREFHLATFNEVNGLVGDDLLMEILDDSFDLTISGGAAYFDMDVLVRNDTGNLLPHVGMEYSMTVKGEHRDTQFTPIGTLKPGESKRLALSLSTTDAWPIRRNKTMTLNVFTEINRYTYGDQAKAKRKDI